MCVCVRVTLPPWKGRDSSTDCQKLQETCSGSHFFQKGETAISALTGEPEDFTSNAPGVPMTSAVWTVSAALLGDSR